MSAQSSERFKVKTLGFNSMANGPAPAIRSPRALYWHNGSGDNASHDTIEGEELAQASGYGFARIEGYVYPISQPGTVPLKLFFHAGRSDFFTTATSQVQQDAQAAGYKLVRIEGFVFPAQ